MPPVVDLQLAVEAVCGIDHLGRRRPCRRRGRRRRGELRAFKFEPVDWLPLRRQSRAEGRRAWPASSFIAMLPGPYWSSVMLLSVVFMSVFAPVS